MRFMFQFIINFQNYFIFYHFRRKFHILIFIHFLYIINKNQLNINYILNILMDNFNKPLKLLLYYFPLIYVSSFYVKLLTQMPMFFLFRILLTLNNYYYLKLSLLLLFIISYVVFQILYYIMVIINQYHYIKYLTNFMILIMKIIYMYISIILNVLIINVLIFLLHFL